MAEGGAGGPSDPRGTGTIPRQGEPPSSQAEHQHGGAHGVTTSDNQQAGQMPPLIILEPTSDRQSSNPKPISVKTVPKKCHDTIQVVQEHYINNTLKTERRTAKEQT